jgi:TPR repeat protein
LAANSNRDLQEVLDEAMALAGAGNDAAALAIWKSIAERGKVANLKTSAAKQGYASALYNLGVLITEGRGEPRDRSKAAEYFRQAAVLGHARAQYNLSILYERGSGVAKDPQRARYWLDRAKASGINPPAR